MGSNHIPGGREGMVTVGRGKSGNRHGISWGTSLGSSWRYKARPHHPPAGGLPTMACRFPLPHFCMACELIRIIFHIKKKNSFIKIKPTYHTNHLFKVHNSMFLVYLQTCSTIPTVTFRTCKSSQKEIPLPLAIIS